MNQHSTAVVVTEDDFTDTDHDAETQPRIIFGETSGLLDPDDDAITQVMMPRPSTAHFDDNVPILLARRLDADAPPLSQVV